MICFKDIAFCASDCANVAGFRRFDDGELKEARVWWGGDNPPIAFSDFSGDCDKYISPETVVTKAEEVRG